MPGGEKVFRNQGWLIRTTKGPIMGDKDLDQYRKTLSVLVLPEMVFNRNRVELVHEASGTIISFNALDALMGWKNEDLPPLQVRVAQEWRKAREHEIEQQKAVQLTYDWTFTTPYTCTVVPPAGSCPPPSSSQQTPTHPVDGVDTTITPAAAAAAAAPGAQSSNSSTCAGAGVPDFVFGSARTAAAPLPTVATPGGKQQQQQQPPATCQHPAEDAGKQQPQPQQQQESPLRWEASSEQIDRGLLMERDPILFYEELPLYESDLDDNGVCCVSLKLRVMPRCWLVLLRCWVRVDGCMVRLRETRLFCRHDKPEKRLEVLQEVKHCEGDFASLRAQGAPEEGPAYTDGDAASQVFQAVAPLGLRLLLTRKLLLPPAAPAAPAAAASAAAAPAAAP